MALRDRGRVERRRGVPLGRGMKGRGGVLLMGGMNCGGSMGRKGVVMAGWR